jgi:integrase
MCVPGVSDDAARYLNSIRIKGNRKGVAVLTMDPKQGRFTDVEFEAIWSVLQGAHATNLIQLDEYVLALLFIALGPRPIQYAAMKVCDFAVASNSSGSTTYIVSVPRAKKREARPRSSFKKRTLIPEIGKVVQEYANEVRNRYVDILDDPDQAPLFPANESAWNAPAGFEFHRTSQSLREWFKNTMHRLQVRSERTGGPINFNASRFRRTLACRAADEGHGEFVIADLLDHEDTQNVGVYTEATPGMMERIDRAVALRLAPLAQAFAGVIISDESQARRAGDPTSRISDPRSDPSMKPVGNCGQFGFCGLLAPVACYTCRSFEPWLDGPHDRVLEFLIGERDRLLTSADKRIASINDRTILAVADVVRRCAEIKAGKKEDQNG